MKPMPDTQRGISLIELVMVIILMSVASAALLQPFTQASRSILLNEQIQIATQLAQERMEGLLTIRRLQGYSDPALTPGTTNDTLAAPYAAYTRTIIINQPAAGGCLVGSTCKDAVVTVSLGGSLLASSTLLLVDY